MTMNEQDAAELRKPFAVGSVGKLPRSTCRACSDSQRKRCDNHQWISGCPECKGSHTSATIHLDFVGHAATTDRLLRVDQGWTWEPLALTPDGLPALDRANNLWIKLTVCGVTRLGVGDGKSAKEMVGDAIRNAAMRFGVALDLWSKDELEQVTVGADKLRQALAGGGLGAALGSQTSGPEDAPAPQQAVQSPATSESSPELLSAKVRGALFALFSEVGIDDDQDQRDFLTDTLGRVVASRADLTNAEGIAGGKRLRRIHDGDVDAAWASGSGEWFPGAEATS